MKEKKESEVKIMPDVAVKQEERKEVDTLEELIKNLSEEDKRKMVIFLQGIKFVKSKM